MKELLDAIYNLIANLNRQTLDEDTLYAIDQVRDAIVRIRINQLRERNEESCSS